MEEIDENVDVPKDKMLQSKTIWQRFKIVVAGAFNNFILGIFILFLMAVIYGSPETKPYIKEVKKDVVCFGRGMEVPLSRRYHDQIKRAYKEQELNYN